MATTAARRARLEVPFLDLAPVHRDVKGRLLAAFAELIDEGAFVNGPAVGAFERSFAAYCGVAEAVGVASGLDALRLALLALGLEPGDEVIVPAATFAATFEAVTQAGGVPVVADVSPLDLCLDADAAEAAVTPRTRALLPVHLYGQLADAAALRAVAARRGLAILEDACQAHGAERQGHRAGAVGTAAAFSFYPGKNLGAMGDAGAVVTDDPGLAREVRALREHGQHVKYLHAREGYTARLDTLQALVLLEKLPHLDAWNAERARVAAAYGERLAGLADLELPPVAPGSRPAWHLYVVRTERPGRLAGFLAGEGVRTARHYPQLPHRSPAYRRLGCSDGAFPVSESLAERCLSLPLFPGISEAQVDAVVAAVRAYFARGFRAR